jgi:hypothetical protein
VAFSYATLHEARVPNGWEAAKEVELTQISKAASFHPISFFDVVDLAFEVTVGSAESAYSQNRSNSRPSPSHGIERIHRRSKSH